MKLSAARWDKMREPRTRDNRICPQITQITAEKENFGEFTFPFCVNLRDLRDSQNACLFGVSSLAQNPS
jgi:hypothetical protein